MSILPEDLLKHILDEVDFLLTEASKLDENSYLGDEKTKRAFARSFEIIGEAAKQFPEEFKTANSHIEWKSMARMRDRLIHHYFGVDYELVWNTVCEDIPRLKIKLLDLQKNL
jgi:uncharacterized protein with HEPN domain